MKNLANNTQSPSSHSWWITHMCDREGIYLGGRGSFWRHDVLIGMGSLFFFWYSVYIEWCKCIVYRIVCFLMVELCSRSTRCHKTYFFLYTQVLDTMDFMVRNLWAPCNFFLQQPQKFMFAHWLNLWSICGQTHEFEIRAASANESGKFDNLLLF